MTVKAGLGYRNDTSLQLNEIAGSRLRSYFLLRERSSVRSKKIYREHKDFFHADNLLRCIANRSSFRIDRFQDEVKSRQFKFLSHIRMSMPDKYIVENYIFFRPIIISLRILGTESSFFVYKISTHDSLINPN